MPERLPHSSPTPGRAPDEPVPGPLQWFRDNSLPLSGLLLLVLGLELACGPRRRPDRKAILLVQACRSSAPE